MRERPMLMLLLADAGHGAGFFDTPLHVTIIAAVFAAIAGATMMPLLMPLTLRRRH